MLVNINLPQSDKSIGFSTPVVKYSVFIVIQIKLEAVYISSEHAEQSDLAHNQTNRTSDRRIPSTTSRMLSALNRHRRTSDKWFQNTSTTAPASKNQAHI
ncbi:hypothetical protein AB6A40_010481 [Gnathostoma spinigerum]|uniref:Uncharacterized protein n=1 Tax=Gnathostoma spinigerum TaxID=75299 RepID=A0ABD6EXD9_9BILA